MIKSKKGGVSLLRSSGVSLLRSSGVYFKRSSGVCLTEFSIKYELQYNNTHLVKAKLLKRNEWQPFRKIGKLSDAGIKFVESKIDQEHEKLWEDYISGR